MERVAFLIDSTGERVFAMINPDELMFERQSGVRRRMSGSQPLASARRSDDAMIITGGGVTDLKLNLLFDVDLLTRTSSGFSQAPDYRTNIYAPPSRGRAPMSSERDDRASIPAAAGPEPVITDVRTLSGPLWALAENVSDDQAVDGPPIVRFIWGAAWNIPCVAISVAERFDFFSQDGSPLRSWMRIHLRRINRPESPAVSARRAPAFAPPRQTASDLEESAAEALVIVDPVSSSRPDLLCDNVYGDTRLMHALLDYNDIDDFWSIEPGKILMTPPAAVLREHTP